MLVQHTAGMACKPCEAAPSRRFRPLRTARQCNGTRL